jgi:hypothetical protein
MNHNYWPLLLLLLMILPARELPGQADRWQQRVSYKMDIDFDVETHHFRGKQNLVYLNNSPDTLKKVFYHLYFNAFQPNSMMDVRSRTILDPSSKIGDRIAGLSEEEIGYHKILSLKMNGQPLDYEVAGTILEVTLDEPILPHSSAVFDMDFESQVPVQIRRSGRNNAEGIAYSMSQWYPKMCEYDYQGWHANPYIAREFYGVWGDFEVRISIDKDYIIGGTGYLQNPGEIGYGYTAGPVTIKESEKKLTWHFLAPNVHDFVWAADPDYTHTSFRRADGMMLHFFFQKNEHTEEPWSQLPEIMNRAFDYINEHFGVYPYGQYSFIQGGDGGMEYPMATLITGERSLSSLVGVSIHELMHSWFQMMLGTNESLYAWMDEGFTSYASAEVSNYLRREGFLPGTAVDNPHVGALSRYINFSQTGLEEPMCTHSDHFFTNAAYSIAAYTKGQVFLNQLKYIIGEEAFSRGMLDYFYTWRFKHPNENDFIRIMEKASGLELDWYKEYFIKTIKTIDYGIASVEKDGAGQTRVTLEKADLMPMPLDLLIRNTDGSTELLTIPLRIMRGHKPRESRYAGSQFRVMEDWPWTNPSYEFTLDTPIEDIQSIEIDPSRRLADINSDNNSYNRE